MPPVQAALPARAEQVEGPRDMEGLSQRCPGLPPAAQGCPRPGRGTLVLVSGSLGAGMDTGLGWTQGWDGHGARMDTGPRWTQGWDGGAGHGALPREHDRHPPTLSSHGNTRLYLC